MNEETAVAFVFFTIVVAGVTIVTQGLRQRTKMLEMAHRERLAMIERGMVPSAGLPGTPYDQALETQRSNRSNRLLSGGIAIIGLGLAIAMVIGFASREGDIAIGIGGAVVVLGAAFVIIALTVYGRGKDVELPNDTPATFNRVVQPRPSEPPRPPDSPSHS